MAKKKKAEVETEETVSEETTKEIDLRTAPIEKVWELYPKLDHLTGNMRLQLEERRRLRAIRYKLFRFQTQIGKKRPLEEVEDIPPGFIEFWLGEKPQYQIDPTGKRVEVPPNRDKTVRELGGYESFAKVWDVDHDLKVYLRHASVWQEWNALLYRVVPIIGE